MGEHSRNAIEAEVEDRLQCACLVCVHKRIGTCNTATWEPDCLSGLTTWVGLRQAGKLTAKESVRLQRDVPAVMLTIGQDEYEFLERLRQKVAKLGR